MYTKTTYVDVPFYCDFSGAAQDNGEMHDNARAVRGGRICYCQDCNKAVCRISSLDFELDET